MKIFVVLLLFAFSSIGYGQEHAKSDPASEELPFYFLDSAKIELSQWHFDLNKLSSMKIVKNYYDSAKRLRGAIFMTSKDPKSYKFLSIKDIINKYQQGLQKPTIFMLDNEILKDIRTFKIDSSYLLKVEITRASDIEYLKVAIPDLTILKIITSTKQNLKKENQIRIRGTGPTAMK
jgi:hypothetical protein